MFNPNSDHEDEDINENQETGSRNNHQTRYHRHSPHIIKYLEDYFRDNQYPTEEQRKKLVTQLRLTPIQIKYWFQNKRSQNKIKQVRQEGIQLRSEIREMAPAEHHLRLENAKLTEEIAILEAKIAEAMRQPVMNYQLVSQGNEAILKLAKRMKRIFLTSMERYEDSYKGSEIKIMTRQISSDPHRTVFFASTSYPVPIPHTTLVDSLRDEKNRVKLDVLNGEIGQKITQIVNGRLRVSVLPSVNINQKKMRILQASSIDPMFLIYSPVDSVAMDNAINGGDADNAIYPEGTGGGEGGGCLIKVAACAAASTVDVECLIHAAVEKIKTLFPY